MPWCSNSSTLRYLVLPLFLRVHLFAFNLSEIYLIIALSRAQFNEICGLYYVILYVIMNCFINMVNVLFISFCWQPWSGSSEGKLFHVMKDVLVFKWTRSFPSALCTNCDEPHSEGICNVKYCISSLLVVFMWLGGKFQRKLRGPIGVTWIFLDIVWCMFHIHTFWRGAYSIFMQLVVL